MSSRSGVPIWYRDCAGPDRLFGLCRGRWRQALADVLFRDEVAAAHDRNDDAFLPQEGERPLRRALRDSVCFLQSPDGRNPAAQPAGRDLLAQDRCELAVQGLRPVGIDNRWHMNTLRCAGAHLRIRVYIYDRL